MKEKEKWLTLKKNVNANKQMKIIKLVKKKKNKKRRKDRKWRIKSEKSNLGQKSNAKW